VVFFRIVLIFFRIGVEDSEEENIGRFFEEGIRFIHQKRGVGELVFVFLCVILIFF